MGQTNRLGDWLNPIQRFPWQTDPYYRFRSAAEVQLAASQGIRLDVNRAGLDDWLRLPGLSIHQARLLTELTQMGVQFHGLEDIAAALNLPLAYLQPIAPILQFCHYEEWLTPTKIGLNTATLDHLLQLPGMSRPLAQKILIDRQQAGPFRNWVEFQQRLQLSAQLIGDWLHYLQI